MFLKGRIVGKGRVYTNDTWRFSTVHCTWEKIEAKNEPSARHNHCAAQYKDKWIVFGGQDATGTYLSGQYYISHCLPPFTAKLNDVWELDLSKNEWKRITPTSAEAAPTPRHASVSILYKNYMVIHGGCDDKT